MHQRFTSLCKVQKKDLNKTGFVEYFVYYMKKGKNSKYKYI
jgi:hypothetical protein